MSYSTIYKHTTQSHSTPLVPRCRIDIRESNPFPLLHRKLELVKDGKCTSWISIFRDTIPHQKKSFKWACIWKREHKERTFEVRFQSVVFRPFSLFVHFEIVTSRKWERKNTETPILFSRLYVLSTGYLVSFVMHTLVYTFPHIPCLV